MLRTLTRLFRAACDPSQLDLGLDVAPPRDADELLALLRELGLARIERCRLTHNRNVMVSFGGGELRVHEGYLGAPLPVLRAIVTFVQGRTRAERRAAQRVIISHPIHSARPAARRDRTHADDGVIAEKLVAWHGRYNARYFHGRLRHVPIRVSRRMKSYTPFARSRRPNSGGLSSSHSIVGSERQSCSTLAGHGRSCGMMDRG